ncbi:MAG: DUF4212 domain-containing protein [Bacteroidetes bacterium]|nr:DUF4212 domain-containing protein [Bacteroidota bacterium]
MNRNMVIWLVSIWFVAVFGFQFLLRILEEPTPQPAYLSFQQVWEPVLHQEAETAQLQTFGQSILSVLGKIAIQPEDKKVLDQALSHTVYTLTPDSLQSDLTAQVREFEKTVATSKNISDPAYLAQRDALIGEIASVVGLDENNVLRTIIPYSLRADNIESLNKTTIDRLPDVMGKYLIHNRSVLTDTRFLGFPFHYFYTAFFLLILFVGLCWLYCVKTDQRNAKLNIVD